MILMGMESGRIRGWARGERDERVEPTDAHFECRVVDPLWASEVEMRLRRRTRHSLLGRHTSLIGTAKHDVATETI